MCVDLNDLLQLSLREGPRWVRDQKAAYRSFGWSLSADEKEKLSPFFGQPVVERARIATVPVIPNPDFYTHLQAQGVPIPLDFSQMSGITFDDLILLSGLHAVPPSEQLHLLFHELVHVVQFELAGIDGFVQRYIAGWAQNGFLYERIPFEAQAYALNSRFAAQPDARFSVHAEVAALLGI
jgi:hypothetical protein